MSRHKYHVTEQRIACNVAVVCHVTCNYTVNKVNKVVLTYTSALARFLCKIVSSVQGNGQDKIIHQYREFVILSVKRKAVPLHPWTGPESY